MEPDEFRAAFSAALLHDSETRAPRVGVLPSSIGATREPWRETPRTRVADIVMRAAGKLGFSSKRFDPEKAASRLEEVTAQLPGLAETYGMLADGRSKELLLTVLRFRVLGPGHVTLPVSRRRYWHTCAAVERESRVATGVLGTPWDQRLDLYELSGSSGPVRYLGLAQEVTDFFALEQYAYRHGGVEIAAGPGDNVVDGGGGWGETALYFSDAVQPDGRVFCFEFVPENLTLLERNLAENPRLREQVEMLPHPLWSRSGERLGFEPAGPVTRVAGADGDQAATSETIDGMRAARDGAWIDFIKLDVEGAELAALNGAEETLESCRPRLAVAVYHRIADMVEIPRFLSERGYELFLDHVTAGPYETVLFARPRRSPA